MRVLTSGQVPNAFDGRELIRQLVKQSDERIIVMPGSGIRSNNIAEIADYTGASELHSSARKIVRSEMEFTQTGMEENLENFIADPEEIKRMKEALTGIIQ